MSFKKKKVEFYKVVLKTLDDKKSDLKFDEILSHKEVLSKEVYIKGKELELKIFANNDDYLVGILETSRNNNLPPKKSRKAKTLSKLGLNIDEGLAYGNVFLYDKKRNILMYEVNKFGCYLDHFISFIYLALKESKLFKKFKIKLEVVLATDEYNRIVNMNFHKSVEVQIANPDKMMDEFKHKNGALFNVCDSGKQMNSSRVFAKFEVEAKKNKQGLTTKTVREVINDVTSILQRKSGENIQKVIVTGYENDIEKLQKIDLIADRYIKEISLDEPRENSNLLEKQRTDEIVKLHKDCLNDLDKIFTQING
jgi:hypothetical protein